MILRPATTVMVGEHITADGGYEYPTYQFSSPTVMTDYHGGRSNILWVEGHVTSESQATLTQEDIDRRQ